MRRLKDLLATAVRMANGQGSAMTDVPDPVPPIDLDHLAAQTFGSAELEREVLRLFLTQSRDCVARLKREPECAGRPSAARFGTRIGARAVERAAAVL